jgi:hypothetical protein
MTCGNGERRRAKGAKLSALRAGSALGTPRQTESAAMAPKRTTTLPSATEDSLGRGAISSTSADRVMMWSPSSVQPSQSGVREMVTVHLRDAWGCFPGPSFLKSSTLKVYFPASPPGSGH